MKRLCGETAFLTIGAHCYDTSENLVEVLVQRTALDGFDAFEVAGGIDVQFPNHKINPANSDTRENKKGSRDRDDNPDSKGR